jgi:hypothetical protein
MVKVKLLRTSETSRMISNPQSNILKIENMLFFCNNGNSTAICHPTIHDWMYILNLKLILTSGEGGFNSVRYPAIFAMSRLSALGHQTWCLGVRFASITPIGERQPSGNEKYLP